MRGFTLLEVLISISLIAFISVVTGQSIQQALSSKKKIQSKIDTISEVESALNLMSTDIEKSFHYEDVYKNIFPREKRSNQNSISQRDPRKNLTFIKGGKDEIQLTTLNYPQISSSSTFGEQAVVSYEVSSCKSIRDKKDTSCLKRKISPYLNYNIEEKKSYDILLEGVEDLSLKYLLQSGKWTEEWAPSESTKEQFPQAVQILISINNPVYKDFPKLTMGTVAKIQFPNNHSKTQTTNQTNSPPQTDISVDEGAEESGIPQQDPNRVQGEF